jgi:outer membrane protein
MKISFLSIIALSKFLSYGVFGRQAVKVSGSLTAERQTVHHSLSFEASMKLFNIISATALIAIHGTVLAAPAPESPPADAQRRAPRLSLGLGVAIASPLYAGEDRDIRGLPMIAYNGERFFWRGIGGGMHLINRDGFSVDATLSARPGAIKRKDFGVSELAERGIDRALLDNRDYGVDLGMGATWRSAMGELEVGVKADVSGASEGFEGSVKYGYPMRLGGTRITPNAGVSFMSKKLANYYFGTLDAEVARGVVNYKPGSATVPVIGIDAMHPLAGNWLVVGGLAYRFLPAKLTDSPLVERDTNGRTSLYVGVSRGF